ncbi:MAG: RecX family transcriptional regulator, partial [Prevotella sp.]|nr:RecX family transcriptional regulator [Prevotella sp.]
MTGQQAFQRLAALCARGEHCQSEMLEKMRAWGVTAEEQAQVMARLTQEHYVDDERFARAFVADKVRYNKWGRRKV